MGAGGLTGQLRLSMFQLEVRPTKIGTKSTPTSIAILSGTTVNMAINIE